MSDIIEEIRNYFKAQKELYGNDLILHSALTEAIPDGKEIETEAKDEEIKETAGRGRHNRHYRQNN